MNGARPTSLVLVKGGRSAYDPQAAGAQCFACPLKGRDVVPPTLVDKPRLAIVGEAPGRLEVSKGIPFIGPSGRLLDAILEEAGFDRANAHITNAVLCRPDDERELAGALACCAPRLGAELAAIPRATILALGSPAAKTVLGKGNILKTRGFIWHAPSVQPTVMRAAERAVEKSPEGPLGQKANARLWGLQARRLIEGRVVIPSVHPAFLLRGADAWRPILAVDVKRAVRWSRGPFKLLDEGKFEVACTAAELRKALRGFGSVVDIDVETDGKDPLEANLVMLGIGEVPRDNSEVDTMRVVLASPWRRSMAPVLQSFLKRRIVVTHNGPSFDELVLGRHGVTYTNKRDTLIAHHAFASHLRQGLDHVASVYCDLPPWKIIYKSHDAAEKGVALGMTEEELNAYNAIDVKAGAVSWMRMQPDLESEQHVYERDMAVARLCQQMQVTGLLIDVGRRDALSKRLRERARRLRYAMRRLVHKKSFSPSRLADVRHMLFEKFKAPVIEPTASGMASTSSATLEAMRHGDTRAARLADLMLRWRTAVKTDSTFVRGMVLGSDGRVHAGWRAFGTESGRPATRDPNVLNIPRMAACVGKPSEGVYGCGVILVDGCKHKKGCEALDMPQPEDQVRDIFVAAPGKQFVYFDLSQAEMRFAAHLSGDERFIETCRGDVHAGNAIVLFPNAADVLREDPKGKGKKWRDIAKNCGFAVTYLAEVQTVFLYLRANGFDVELRDVEDMLWRMRDSYKRYYQYVEENVRLCRSQGHLRTAFLGRIRWMGWFPKPTTVANFPIQSGVADVMGERLLWLDERKPRDVRLVLYAYDAGVYECRSGRDARLMKELIRECWARPIEVPHNGLSFMQPIDLKEGDRWSDFG
jgi:uracil-DNA glycosylase family 4